MPEQKFTQRKRLAFSEILNQSLAGLAEYCEELTQGFEAQEDESPTELDQRLSRSIDQLPDLYSWFVSLYHRQVAITEAHSLAFGTRSAQFKEARVKKDFLEDQCRVAKLRYEGASRRITLIQAERQSMPTAR